MNLWKKTALALTVASVAMGFNATVMADQNPSGVQNQDAQNQNLASAEITHPQDIVKTATNSALSALGKSDKSDASIRQILDEHIMPHVDFRYMSYLTLGKDVYKTASDDQRDRMADVVEQDIVNQYTKFLKLFSDQTVSFAPYEPLDNPSRAKVCTAIEQSNGDDIQVDYSLYKTKQGEWKVYNLNAMGVNIGKILQGQYRDEMRKAGSLEKFLGSKGFPATDKSATLQPDSMRIRG